MARISTYTNDTQIAGDERVIATNSDNVTVNIPINDLQTFILTDEVLSDDQVPAGRYSLISSSNTLEQGLLSETSTSVDDVAIPTSVNFQFRLSRDGEGFVVSVIGYGAVANEPFPYSVESFIGKNWVADGYATEANQTITGFLDPAFTVSNNVVTWRFRTTITTPLSQDSAAGTVGRALTNVSISSLNLKNIVVSNGLIEAASDVLAATAGVPINGLYSNAGAVRIRRT